MLTFFRLPEKSVRPGQLTSELGAWEGDGERRLCKDGKRGLLLLLLLMFLVPLCGWFGEVRPEAMPSSNPVNESVSTAREVTSLSLDGPGWKPGRSTHNQPVYKLSSGISA